MSWSPRRCVLPALVVASLVLSGCGKDEPKKNKSQETKDGSTLAAVWPLTGLPANGPTPKNGVIVVKMPNTAEADPQAGLSKADMVTEQLVEGGITRLAVSYYSTIPDKVGPIRSERTSDIGIVKPARGVLISSGGAPYTVDAIKKAKINAFTEGQLPGFYRVSTKRAPYNLYLDLQKLAKAVPGKPVVPPSYLPWGDKPFAGKTAATSMDVKFSPARTTQWNFRGGKYVNTNGFAPANDRFRPDSVLVLRVRQADAGYLDLAGNPVPESIYKGNGPAMVFHKGKMIRATWSKKGYAGALKLTTNSGEMEMPPGKVWISLVPTDADGGKISWK